MPNIKHRDNIKDRDEKQPGEKPPGKFHYNPVNMAGKKGAPRDDCEPAQDAARDKPRSK